MAYDRAKVLGIGARRVFWVRLHGLLRAYGTGRWWYFGGYVAEISPGRVIRGGRLRR